MKSERAAERIDDLAIVVVNFNTSRHTLECLRSLEQLPVRPLILELIDNASHRDDLSCLQEGLRTVDLPVRLELNPQNAGFAGACDEAIRRLLQQPEVARIMLFNNDAVALPAMASWLRSARGDLCGACMMRKDDPSQVDSLGIVMYRSGLASNRMSSDEPLFGPTGGCAIYSRRVLEALIDRHGHAFDARFFCYAEDTDLAFRALLLGFEPEYCDDAVALHEGQASSGGAFNDFILYHGIRNSMWVLIKNAPVGVLLRCAHYIAIMYLAIAILYVRRGRIHVVWRIFRDAARLGWPILRARREVQAYRRLDSKNICIRISPKFYHAGRLRSALVQLWKGKE